MDGHNLTNEQILAFSTALFQAERSQATVDKYLRSVQAFSLFLDGRPVTKDTEKRNRYQKVIICVLSSGGLSLPIATQILRCRRRSL